MHLTVLTGASRGLGRALAGQLLARGHRVLAIARQRTELPVPPGADLQALCLDLSDPVPAAQALERWLATQALPALESATLIHNAGVLTTPAPLSDLPLHELSQALRVGLEAPLLLSAVFLRATDDLKAQRKLLFISSGLGRYAMAGSAAYCAAKAGMDNLARSIALEEAAKPNGARVVSLAPGVIDTDMQTQLRGADAALFPERERFAALQRNGQLVSPAQGAARVLAWLDRGDFGDKVLADVRQL